MKLSVQTNFPEVEKQLKQMRRGVERATREALNRTAEWAATDVRLEMSKVFDRPVPFSLRSLRVYYASSSNLSARLWFRQRRADEDKLWAVPQIHGGGRDVKPMEQRLRRLGVLPSGWFVVPGAGAPLDAYGNMRGAEVSRILNIIGAFTEAGYNKANDKTRARLKRGNKRRGQYGFEYWVNPVATYGKSVRQRHLLPGIYRRYATGFGSSLKPMLIFVKAPRYRSRLDFEGVVSRSIEKRFPDEFKKAAQSLLQTGSASGFRRGLGAQ